MSLQLLLMLDEPEPTDAHEALLRVHAQRARLTGIVQDVMKHLYPDFEEVVDEIERREKALRMLLLPVGGGDA